MIGRGALKDPEIFNILHQYDKSPQNDERLPLRKDKPRLDTFISFHNEIFDSYKNVMFGEKPVLFKMKELWAWFSAYTEISAKELKKIRKAGSLADYITAVNLSLQPEL